MDLRGLKVRHLEIMQALAETGQIGAAAHRLGLSQPAASRTVAEIERMLGTAVCEREPRGVALTPVGEALAGRARTILLELRQAAREIGEMASGGGGEVFVGAVTAPMIAHVVPAITELRRDWPDVRYHLEVSTSDRLIDGLLLGRFDMVLARLPSVAEPAAFDVAPLSGERLDLLCDADHPLVARHGSGGAAGLAEAADYDWIMQPRPALSRLAVEAAFGREGLAPPERIIDTTSFLATLGLLRGGRAVAPVAEEAIAFLSDGLASRLRRVRLAPSVEVEPYALIGRARHAPSPAAARLRDLLLDRARPARNPASPFLQGAPS